MKNLKLEREHRKLVSGLTLLLVFGLIAAASTYAIAGDDLGELVRVTRKPSAEPKPPQKRQRADKPKPSQKANYSNPKRPLTKAQAELANKGASAVGVTVWRLLESSSNDAVALEDEKRDLTHPGEGLPQKDVIPERVAMDTALTEGHLVRLTIESLRTGYLYVINRPRYADGKYGDPYLIFPTQRMGVSNLVTAGQTIQIPGPNARPDFFVLDRGKSREGELQVSEELIVIVKPEPFEVFKTPPSDRKLLTQPSVEALIEKYKADVEESDLGGDASKYITKIEKLASKDASIRLSPDDPYPQTLYRLAVKPDDPMLVRFELMVKAK